MPPLNEAFSIERDGFIPHTRLTRFQPYANSTGLLDLVYDIYAVFAHY